MSSSEAEPTLALEWLPGRYAVCRLDPEAPLPDWAMPPGVPSGFITTARTDQELSIVVEESRLPVPLPAAMKVQRGLAALRVAATLDFSIVGLLASLTTLLADARIPVFVVSTFQTDYLLFDQQYIVGAQRALTAVARIPGRDS